MRDPKSGSTTTVIRVINGPPAPGLVWRNECGEKRCVNPDHGRYVSRRLIKQRKKRYAR